LVAEHLGLESSACSEGLVAVVDLGAGVVGLEWLEWLEWLAFASSSCRKPLVALPRALLRATAAKAAKPARPARLRMAALR